MSGRVYEWKNLGNSRTVKADVVIVGTGCGGSTLAYELSKNGKK
ncbi:hypothetical protein LEP1GSC043_0823 [Leptospira weilii str. Ecochallenge]|nr:hypothetical protein LEP1GSC038_4201 [Leptospira weilii str. 2006001855]EMY12378.1 hypothetical protein LEP1GSC043_0823 [Leptospira weilii str. Ecochallenge]